MEKYINKSVLLNARRCSKAAYLLVNNPELADKDLLLGTLLKKSQIVDAAAQQLFPGGTDVNEVFDITSKDVFQDFCDFTDFLINDDETRIIYGACFQKGKLRCKVDVLVIGPKVWRMYEVKSSTSIQDEHIIEIAYQAHVILKNYPRIKLQMNIIHLNNRYVRQGELNLDELFHIQNLTSKCRYALPLINRYISISQDVFDLEKAPSTNIGTKCIQPDCEFKSHCFKKVPAGSVLELSKMWGIKKFQLYDQGIIHMKDIPSKVRLTDKQVKQVECEAKQRNIVDEEAIKDYLSDVKFPVYFLDFETIMPPVPLYDDMKPWSHLPIQYSLHKLEWGKTKSLHSEFLAELHYDCRRQFIVQLIADLGSKGTIFVYNEKFEIARLRECAKYFPAYESKIESIIRRIKDMMIPFEDRMLYSPEQHGSVSLKKVLPAWIPSLSYGSLEISSGTMIEENFDRMCDLRIPEEERLTVRKNMLEYCKMDTYAMVKLYECLRALSTGSDYEIAA